MFQFVLFTEGDYFKIPEALKADLAARHGQAVIAVQVTDSKNGVVHFWTLAKFRYKRPRQAILMLIYILGIHTRNSHS